MKIEVAHEWAAGDAGDAQVFEGGVQDVTLTAPLAVLIASGESAGIVRVLEATPDEERLLDDNGGHVESQEESEAALVEARGDWVAPVLREDGTSSDGYWDGPWYEGHLASANSSPEVVGSVNVTPDIDPVAEEEVE